MHLNRESLVSEHKLLMTKLRILKVFRGFEMNCFTIFAPFSLYSFCFVLDALNFNFHKDHSVQCPLTFLPLIYLVTPKTLPNIPMRKPSIKSYYDFFICWNLFLEYCYYLSQLFYGYGVTLFLYTHFKQISNHCII